MARRAVIVGVLLVALAASSHANYFLVRTGAFYDTGDFGTSRNFHTWYFPVTVKGVYDPFDVSLTAAWVYLTTQQRLALAEGIPNPSGELPPQTSASGPNDTVLRVRYFLLKDPGGSSLIPALSPYLKVKFPSGNPDKQLGTGRADYGFGLTFDKMLEPFYLYGDAGYTIVGKPPGEDLQNRPSAGIGAGFFANKRASLSAELDWRKALVKGFDDPFDLIGIFGYKLSSSIQLGVYGLKGLSNGSPQYGGGADISYKFGMKGFHANSIIRPPSKPGS